MDNPVFILGNPRSGTTLLRVILTSHSKINIPPESEFIVRLYPKYGFIRNFSKRQLHELIDDISGESGLVNLEEQWEIKLKNYKLNDIVGMDYAGVCASFYKFYAEEKGFESKLIWGDKNNSYGNYIDILSEMYPNAKFIHIVRDGRACLNSYKKLNVDKSQKYAPLLPKNVKEVAVRWVDMVCRIDRHLKKNAPERYKTVRYEELLEGIDKTLHQLSDFLGVDFEENMLNYYVVNQQHNLEPKKYSWKENTFKPLDVTKASSWKKELPREDVKLFEAIAGATLQRFGYGKVFPYKRNTRISKAMLILRIRELMRAIRNNYVKVRKYVFH